MRIPLATPLKSRPNDTTKDARVRNGVIEKRGEQSVVRTRPGAADLGEVDSAGVAQLVTCWDGALSVVGDSLASLVITESSEGYTGDTDFFPWGDGDVGGAYYNGVPLYQPMYIPLDDGDLVLAGCEDDFTFYSFYGTRGSLTEQSLGFSFIGEYSAPWAIARNTNVVLITTFDDGISGDGARGFVSSTSGTPSFTEAYADEFGSDPRADSANEYLFLMVDGEVRYSDDDGQTWGTLTNPVGITHFDGVFYLSGYWYFVTSSSGPNTIEIYRTNTFASFSEVILSGDTGYLTNGNSGRQKCVTKFGDIAVIATTSGVVTSTDGATWALKSGLVGTVYADATYLYVITSTGVYISSDAETFELLISVGFAIDNAVLPTAGSSDGFFCLNDASNITYQITITYSPGGDSVTPTPIANLTPVVADLPLTAEGIGASQSTQQLLIKSRDQAWIYTRD
jgi:hypothetical protein